ncbi:MAG TPA: hypothetical protein VIK04_20815 [Solirubrobacteraceae bacterium]
MPPAERDIELVLVTGAGASMGFGRDGAQTPMMREWAEILTRHLGSDAGLVGLSATLDGPAFEERLGIFLQRVAALKLSGPMLEDLAHALGPEWSVPGRAGLTELGWTNWHANATARLDHVIGLIHGSLYEQFGAENIDLFGASRAFSALLTSVGIHSQSKTPVLPGRRVARWIVPIRTGAQSPRSRRLAATC